MKADHLWGEDEGFRLAFANFEHIGFRDRVIEQRLFDLFLLRHLPVDPLPPSGPQCDSQASPLFLERDRGVRRGLETDVSRTGASRSRPSGGRASRRHRGAHGTVGGTRAPREVACAMDGDTAAITFARPCTFGHLSPFPLSSARPIQEPVRSHGRPPIRSRSIGRVSAKRPGRMPGMRRAPPARRRLRSMCRMRVFEMRMNADGPRPFQWKRLELNSRVRTGPVEGGLKDI